jgi:ABC-type glycerol-3-phosphate transport system permease component
MPEYPDHGVHIRCDSYPFLYVSAVLPRFKREQHHIPWPDPRFLHAESYKRGLTNQWIGYGFVNTVTRVLTAAPLTLVVMLLAAYPLSKPYFPHRSSGRGFWYSPCFSTAASSPLIWW